MVDAGSERATLAALADCDEEEGPCAILFSLHDDIISSFASLKGMEDEDWGIHGGYNT